MVRYLYYPFIITGVLVFGCAESGGDSDGSGSGNGGDTMDSSGGDSVGDSSGQQDTGFDGNGTGVVDAGMDQDSDGIPDYLDSDLDICGEGEVSFGIQIPTVMLLIDQSSSMYESFGDTDRWTAVYQTLFDPNGAIVTDLQNEVRFGMQLYSSVNGYEGGDCPMLTGVDPALSNWAAMNSVFQENDPIEDTPTGESIDAVVGQLQAVTEPGAKIIVLATDGEPDTCAVPDPQQGQPESIAAAQNAYASGIPVFVISVGSDVGEDHLSELANAGQGFDVDDPNGATYYMGLDADSLKMSFDDIISGVRTCVLTLEGAVDEGQEARCGVAVDGTALQINTDNGWRLNSPTEIEVLGTACDGILNGDTTSLSVKCPCGVIGPV